MDQTRAPVLDPGRRKTWTGDFRALVLDDRSHAPDNMHPRHKYIFTTAPSSRLTKLRFVGIRSLPGDQISHPHLRFSTFRLLDG